MSKPFKDEIKTKLKDDKKLFVLNVMYTAAWLDQLYSPIFKSNGITNTQYNVLRILKGSHPTPLSVGEIKERIMFKQSDITRMIDRLVDKNLVCRELCKDNRRKMDVSITQTGVTLLEKMYPEIDVAEQKHFENISKEEAQKASEIIDKLRDI